MEINGHGSPLTDSWKPVILPLIMCTSNGVLHFLGHFYNYSLPETMTWVTATSISNYGAWQSRKFLLRLSKSTVDDRAWVRNSMPQKLWDIFLRSHTLWGFHFVTESLALDTGRRIKYHCLVNSLSISWILSPESEYSWQWYIFLMTS